MSEPACRKCGLEVRLGPQRWFMIYDVRSEQFLPHFRTRSLDLALEYCVKLCRQAQGVLPSPTPRPEHEMTPPSLFDSSVFDNTPW